MNKRLKLTLGGALLAIATQVGAQVTFYEGEGFSGRSFTADKPVRNLERAGFNDRAASVVVNRGRWEVCEDSRFEGQCVMLRPGQYESLRAIGLSHSISSVRPVPRDARDDADWRERPAFTRGNDYRRRGGERLHQAEVTGVRAVVGRDEQQRCWVEREQVVQDRRGGANVPGAIAGAIIGGILGHQVGGGRGQDIATAGGAVGGAALGANIGRGGGGQETYSQDVQRCTSVPGSAQPAYWDVTYNFRGQQHRVQTSAPPGRTITVNENGEPRV